MLRYTFATGLAVVWRRNLTRPFMSKLPARFLAIAAALMLTAACSHHDAAKIGGPVIPDEPESAGGPPGGPGGMDNPDGPGRPDGPGGPGGPQQNDRFSPVKILMPYDANHDGSLTRAEMEAGLKADFDAADLNHDGKLQLNEIRAVNDSRWKEDNAAASPLVDWNGDGVVDFGEFAATARSLFAQVDANDNGILSPIELNPKAKPKGGTNHPPVQHGGGPGGGQGGPGGPGGGPGG
jgi:hypothetical protein